MRSRTAITGRLFLFIAIAASCSGLSAEEAEGGKATTLGQTVAVVELFTSEGCSSCPPADRLLKKIAGDGAAPSILVLSYHVDYWNHIGWKDPYSRVQFTQRQREYAAHLLLDNLYTPQVVVNGTEEFVGSDEGKLRKSLANKPALPMITIEAIRKTPGIIQLSYALAEVQAQVLNIALVQKNASTKVRSGENGGETLHHVNVVHQLKRIEPLSKEGTTELNFPAGLKENEFIIIAFTQQKRDYRITGAAQLFIPIP